MPISPALKSIVPQTVTASNDAVDVVLSGKDFTTASVVNWNGKPFTVSL